MGGKVNIFTSYFTKVDLFNNIPTSQQAKICLVSRQHLTNGLPTRKPMKHVGTSRTNHLLAPSSSLSSMFYLLVTSYMGWGVDYVWPLDSTSWYPCFPVARFLCMWAASCVPGLQAHLGSSSSSAVSLH